MTLAVLNKLKIEFSSTHASFQSFLVGTQSTVITPNYACFRWNFIEINVEVSCINYRIALLLLFLPLLLFLLFFIPRLFCLFDFFFHSFVHSFHFFVLCVRLFPMFAFSSISNIKLKLFCKLRYSLW